MKPRYLALFAIPLLAACHSEPKHAADQNGDVEIGNDEGRVAFDLPFVKGDIKLPAALARHGKVDIEGVGLPDGARMSGFSVIAEDDGAKVNIGFKSPDTPEQVKSHFLNAFKAKGLSAELKDGAVVTATSDGKPVTITAEAESEGSTGMISIKD